MRETTGGLPNASAGTPLAPSREDETIDTTMPPANSLTTVLRSKAWLLAAGLGLLALAATSTGARDTHSPEAESGPVESEIEQRVMALIADRRPDAAILAFPTFPALVQKVARDADLDYRLVLAIIEQESGYRHDKVGASGEIGLMQILPATAEAVARELDVPYTPPTPDQKGGYRALGSLGDPAFNLRVGIAYLGEQVKRYGLNAIALRAYNRSPARAREHRPEDRYAEEIGLRYVALAHALRD